MPGWFYTNDRGERVREELTAEQAAADATLVQQTQALQGVLAEGGQFAAEHLALIEDMKRAVDTLPPKRAEHQRLELKSMGVRFAEAKKADAKAEKKIESLGGSK